jgi:L-fuconolactonase
MAMRIDAHQHFWLYDPVRDAWIDETMQTIRKDFMPEDLEPLLREQNMDGCVTVQVDQSENETLFMLDLAVKYPFIKSVVGWVDLRADDIADRLGHFSEYEKLAGFRHILQAEEPERMLEPEFLRGINALKEFDFTYDILIYPEHLDAALELAGRFPDQKFVIDHMAKPEIRNGKFESWAKKMKEFAGFENVWCKVSGLITEADWENWTPEQLKPYLDHVFESFGTKRLMFGSDWPVCLLAGSYVQVHLIIREYLEGFSDLEKEDVYGNNAISFYNINENSGS